MPKSNKKTSQLPERFYSKVDMLREGKWKRKVRFWFFFLLIVLVIIWFVMGGIQLRFTFMDSDSNVLWSLLTALLFGMYVYALGFSVGINKLKWRILIFVIILIVYLGFSAFLGIEITINFPAIFFQKTFGTNTPNGVLFFTMNIPQWGVLLFGSLPIEKEE